jgi:hypothetical protein
MRFFYFCKNVVAGIVIPTPKINCTHFSFSRVCNEEFGNNVAGGTNAAESLSTKQKALFRVLFLWRKRWDS